jgi:hypothetical protein
LKVPSPVGTPINISRMRRWTSAFASYRHQVSEAAISDWLDQFGNDKDVGARLLDVVDFYSLDRISGGYRDALLSLPGWSKSVNQRTGKWRFAALARSAGESGDAMLHRFRIANRLDGAKYDDLFIHPSQILLQDLGADDSLVLIDDFVGTGESVKKIWESGYAELVPEIGKVYLIVIVALDRGRQLVNEKTSMTCVPAHQLTESDNFFADENNHFSNEEKACILAKCSVAKKKEPKGYGDCGLVVIFAHRCPNNSLPILHVEHNRWVALFPRHG